MILLVSLAGYLFILQQRQFLLNEKQKEISTIADLKTSQLVQWRKERFAEGASIRSNRMMAHRINDYFAGRDSDKVRQEFRIWLSSLIDLGSYSRGILFSPDGEIIATDSELNTPLTQHYFNLVAEVSREHEIILSDFHSDGVGVLFDLDLVVPIMDVKDGQSRCLAVLLLDIDPAKRLNSLIQSWSTPSSTAETLLVRREGDFVLFLNELRFREKSSTPFMLPIANQNVPAVKVVLGHEGTYKGIDYRNKEVLSATRIVPGTRWGLVAKIDVSEVTEPLSKIVWYVSIAAIILITALILGVFLWGAQLKLRQEAIEKDLLEQQLLRTRRLEAIGQIAGGVAHEVRNPLNAILTITEALFREKEIAANSEFEPYIMHIRTQVNRLVNLMNDLLDLGRTIPETNLQPVILYDVCRETLDLWNSAGLSINRNGLLAFDNDDISTKVFADNLRLQQILFNLLENAGHNSPAGSKILLRMIKSSAELTDNMAIVQVIDHGTGIAEDKLSRVFDPFYTERKGGTGLGLALVKHFVENMGGTVQIWNNIPPPGCTVEIKIPLYREDL